MVQEKDSLLRSPMVRKWLIVTGILALLLSLPVCASLNLWYGETKGPFKNWTQVLDLDGEWRAGCDRQPYPLGSGGYFVGGNWQMDQPGER